MVRTRRAAGALGAVGLLLSACSSGSPAATPPSTSTTATTPTASSSTAAPSSSTTKPTPKGDPNVPPAARAHTRAGAKAFVVAYMDAVNATGQRPRVGVLESLALDSCKSCNNFENQVKDLVDKRQRFSGRIASSAPQDARSFEKESARVFVRIHQNVVKVVLADGKVVDRSTANDAAADFFVKWIGDRWKVAKIYDA